MAREITGAREHLARIEEEFPDKELLSKSDIHRFLGIARNTLKKYYPELWKSAYTSKTDLAKILARRGLC